MAIVAVLHHQLILFSSPSWTVTHCLSQSGLNSSYFNLTSAEITGMNYDAQLMVNNVHCLLIKINGKKKRGNKFNNFQFMLETIN